MSMFSWLWRGWVGDDAATLETREGLWGTFMVIYAWFLGLQLLDLGTTLAVLQKGGVEANRLGPAQALEALGPEALLAIKLVVVVATMLAWLPAVAWLERMQSAKSTGIVMMVLLLGALFYTGVVFWNIVVFRFLLG